MLARKRNGTHMGEQPKRKPKNKRSRMTEADPQVSSDLVPAALIAAVIGWATTTRRADAFHPREEKRILGLRIQGVFPKRQKALAEKLGQLVARELFSLQDVRKHLQGEEFIAHATDTIEAKVDEFLHEKLAEAIPMASMFLGSGMIDTIKRSLVESLAKALPELGEMFVSHLEKNMDVETVVREKVEAFSSDKLEEMCWAS